MNFFIGGEEHLAEEREAKKIKILSNDQRREIYLALLKKSVDGKLKKDTSRSVASLFSVSMRTVQRIWKQAKNSLNACGVVDVSHRKTKNCGRKRIQIDVEKFKSIPLNQRTTLESTACALSIGKTTLHRNLQEGRIKRHTNPLRPYLKDDNKKARLQFCISMLEENGIHHDPIFSSLENTVFIDEKWFYMTKKSETYYLLGDEEEPHRTCKSKNFVEKIMFLAAIARPRFDEDGNVTFDGKIGIFPFVTKEPAKRTSVNRVAGTLETKAMTSIGRDINRSFLTQKVIPAILAKWPPEDFGKTIVIQQDNARTHIDPNDEVFRECVSRQNFDIQLKCQPPNSPDLNILDLGFFNAIQSLKHKEAPKTVDDLVRAVENAFENFSPIKSNMIFLTLQQCMVEIMKVGGSNRYKIPHMSKAALERQGQLPRQIKCDKKLVEDVLSVL